jgi:D-arabinose 1-dehydrogenase-like Zn-dependent alcohol dehydrogenase
MTPRRDGCFAEYIAVPDTCCIKNDPALPWEVASIQEPFGNATYCVSESQVAGKSVAIFGDGPIGIFAVAIARAYGATNLIALGMQPYRLDLIRRYSLILHYNLKLHLLNNHYIRIHLKLIHRNNHYNLKHHFLSTLKSLNLPDNPTDHYIQNSLRYLIHPWLHYILIYH